MGSTSDTPFPLQHGRQEQEAMDNVSSKTWAGTIHDEARARKTWKAKYGYQFDLSGTAMDSRPATGQSTQMVSAYNTMGPNIAEPWQTDAIGSGDKRVRINGKRNPQIRGINCPGPSRPSTGTITRPATGMSVASSQHSYSNLSEDEKLKLLQKLQGELAQVDGALQDADRTLAESRAGSRMS